MTIKTKIQSLLESSLKNSLHLNGNEPSFKTIVTLENTQLTINLCSEIPKGFLIESFIQDFKAAICKEFPQYSIEIGLDQFIKAHRTQLPGQALRGIKNTIAVASGKGGVGKSTVAVNLAIALAKAGARVGILDADIYGPSIPIMLGGPKEVLVSGEHYLPVEACGIYAMSIGYLTQDDPALIWRGPMLAKALLQMINITQWDELDYLFIDLPPGTGDIQLSLVQKIPLTAAIIVTTPQMVATADAEKAIKMFEKTNIDVLGLVENMSHYHCTHCGHEDHIFGAGGARRLSERFNCPLLGELPLETQVMSHSDKGEPIAFTENAIALPYWKTAFNVSFQLSKKPLNYADKFPPIVVE
ncbi:Mrp/NBP35 family ATP-binding protein [Legionella adelaidensis]|nr:Mrp/NBP35 family ATP-binding protein [Legionella adelaidensis]